MGDTGKHNEESEKAAVGNEIACPAKSPAVANSSRLYITVADACAALEPAPKLSTFQIYLYDGRGPKSIPAIIDGRKCRVVDLDDFLRWAEEHGRSVAHPERLKERAIVLYNGNPGRLLNPAHVSACCHWKLPRFIKMVRAGAGPRQVLVLRNGRIMPYHLEEDCIAWAAEHGITFTPPLHLFPDRKSRLLTISQGADRLGTDTEEAETLISEDESFPHLIEFTQSGRSKVLVEFKLLDMWAIKMNRPIAPLGKRFDPVKAEKRWRQLKNREFSEKVSAVPQFHKVKESDISKLPLNRILELARLGLRHMNARRRSISTRKTSSGGSSDDGDGGGDPPPGLGHLSSHLVRGPPALFSFSKSKASITETSTCGHLTLKRK